MKNWSLGKKIGGGFAIMLILLSIVSFWAIKGVMDCGAASLEYPPPAFKNDRALK